MSLSARISGLESAVKRLESLAGMGRKCAFCRLTMRSSWPAPAATKPLPEDILKVKCQFCRLDYTVSLAGVPAEERDTRLLYYSFTLEDYYTNPKSHAFGLWLESRPERWKKKEAQAVRAARGRKSKETPGARALAALREEVKKLVAQKHTALKAKYGEDPFPEQRQLVESVRAAQTGKRKPKVYPPGLFDLQREETGHLVCAELEKIVWGKTRPGTAAAVERLGREIDELIRTAEAESERR